MLVCDRAASEMGEGRKLEPRARVELATCRLRIAPELNDPNPRIIGLKDIRDLRFDGFGLVKTVLGGTFSRKSSAPEAWKSQE
jgi:hypothetical protein